MEYSRFYEPIIQIILNDISLDKLNDRIIHLIESNYDSSTIGEETIKGLKNYINNSYNNDSIFIKELSFILYQIISDIDEEPKLVFNFGSEVRSQFQYHYLKELKLA